MGPRLRRGLTLALYPLTLASVALSQLPLQADEPLLGVPQLLWHTPARAVGPLQFALGLMAILTTHELGHLWAARRHGVRCGWPVFVPCPTLFGTLGAVLPMYDPAPHRRALLRIGAMGPLWGGAIAAAMYAWGRHATGGHDGAPSLHLGPSLLTWALDRLLPSPPGSPLQGSLGPVALAGWVGLLHTGLNLVPMGNLDGGHILYAVAPAHHRRISWGVALALCAGALAAALGAERTWPSVLLWPLVALVQAVWGMGHAGCSDDGAPLVRQDAAWAVSLAALGACTWVLAPMLRG